jgi:RimJ/RimL family protein N-acetyltransferase/uncharacterized glyoxalase superfamily protein PhnB
VIPRIVVPDARGLVQFIQHAFGATGDYRFDVPAILRLDDSVIMISDAGARDAAVAFLYVYVANVDEAFRRAIDAGARSVEKPFDLPYGDRRGMVEDQWGNTWQIASRIASGGKPHPNPMKLSTELAHCVLRPWQITDKPNLVRYANNRAIWRNLLDSFPHPYTEADAEHWLEHTKADPGHHFAIEVENTAVGGIGVIPQQGVGAKTANFGYWLAEAWWGKGIATAATRALAAHAFEVMPFWRLEAPVFAWNPASMRVLEKSGFSREGVLRKSVFKDGELVDCVMYAKVRESIEPSTQG